MSPADQPGGGLLRFLRYAAIGGVGTAVHYAILIGLVSAGPMEATVATTIGAIAGALVNFYLNATLNFRTGPSLVGAARFLSVAALGIAVNAAIVLVLSDRMAANYLVAQVAATGAVLLATFAANSLWTFRRR